LQDLEQRWSEGHRLYHTLAHLDFCLAELEGVRHLMQRPAEVFFAAFAHDVVHDPRRSDNETRSVEWALQILQQAGVSAEARERVAWLILSTRHDRVPEELDAQLLMDADLAILAQASERYAEYERLVRKEYHHLPRVIYRIGRARILKGLLRRHAVYLSEAFRDRYEDAARANLKASLASLRSLRGRLGL
jgi:predicted metal-dependent HD superfamily phosphohydrolase